MRVGVGPNLKHCEFVRGSLAVIAAGVFVAGCASPQPLKTFVREDPGYDAAAPRIDRVGVFVDGVIAYGAISGKYFDIDDSKTAIAKLLEKTKSALAEKGYTVDFTETPFVGGFLTSDGRFEVAQARHGDHKALAPPFEAKECMSADPAYCIALVTASQGIITAVSNKASPTITLRSDSVVTKALTEIAAKKNIRYLLVVQGNGLVESGLKQAGEGVGTAVLTGLLTMGALSVSVHPVSYLDSYVGLIDLENLEVLWSNSVRLSKFDPGDPDEYEKWSRQLLYYLPSQAKLNAENLPAR